MTTGRDEPTRLPLLGCPDCGGRTTPGPGGRYDCAYCGGRFLAADGDAVPALTPAQHLGAATAFHAAVGWLREQEIAPAPPLRPGAVSLLFVPYWRYEALLSGWVLARRRGAPAQPGHAASDGPRPASGGGTDESPLAALLRTTNRRGEEARLAAYLAADAAVPPPPTPIAPATGEEASGREPHAGALLRPVAWSGPACDVREFGLVGVHQFVDESRLVPFDFAAAERAGAICQAHGGLTAVRRQAERAVLNQIAPAQLLLRRRTSFVREKVALVYYPLHIVKYQARGLRCRLVLDGVRGHVLAGIRPAQAADDAWRLLGGVSLWSCLWAATAAGALGSLPLLWLLDARGRAGPASPRALALRAQQSLARPRPLAERF